MLVRHGNFARFSSADRDGKGQVQPNFRCGIAVQVWMTRLWLSAVRIRSASHYCTLNNNVSFSYAYLELLTLLSVVWTSGCDAWLCPYFTRRTRDTSQINSKNPRLTRSNLSSAALLTHSGNYICLHDNYEKWRSYYWPKRVTTVDRQNPRPPTGRPSHSRYTVAYRFSLFFCHAQQKWCLHTTIYNRKYGCIAKNFDWCMLCAVCRCQSRLQWSVWTKTDVGMCNEYNSVSPTLFENLFMGEGRSSKSLRQKGAQKNIIKALLEYCDRPGMPHQKKKKKKKRKKKGRQGSLLLYQYQYSKAEKHARLALNAEYNAEYGAIQTPIVSTRALRKGWRREVLCD